MQGWRRVAGIALALVAVGGVACAGGGDAGGSADGAAVAPAQQDGSRELMDRDGPALGRPAADTGSDISGAAFGQSAALPKLGPSVIKTGEVEVEVDRGKFQDSMTRALGIASRYGGFVLSSSTDGDRSRSGTVVIRVPAQSFEAALDDLKDLGGVTREKVSGQDVSEEFVDLQARLRNFEAQEKVLLRLMDEATTVASTIAVQRELTGIQLEIERIRGRIRFLSDQTELSTLTVSMFEEGVVAHHKEEGRVGTLARAWDRAVDLFFGLISGVIVASGLIVPLALLGVVAFLVLRRWRPRLTH